jgi:hypothetical protein
VSAPQPTLSLDDFRRQSRVLQQKRIAAREDYEAHAQAEAQAEHDYRLIRSQAFAEAKAQEGTTAAQAEFQADADSAPNKLKRDLSRAKAKAALLRIEALEADRATLRSIAEWSRAIDGGLG